MDSTDAAPEIPPGASAPEADGPRAVTLALDGPPLEFRSLFDEHFSYVWHALRRLGVEHRDLEDLTHDVFMEVYRARHRYDPRHPLRAWLFGFAFRLASNHRRRARQRFEVFADPADYADAAPSPLDCAVTSEALSLAHRALEGLEINRRAVFLMHEVDGFSIPEVARSLSIPLNTAYSRLRLARREFLERVRRLRDKEP